MRQGLAVPKPRVPLHFQLRKASTSPTPGKTYILNISGIYTLQQPRHQNKH